MKLFGYDASDGDERAHPRALREATVVATADELRAIADFLRRCADELEQHGPRFGHEHLCDFVRGTPLAAMTDDADVIAVRAGT